MKRVVAMAAAAAMLSAGAASAGYVEMANEIEGYRPPALWGGQVAPVTAGVPAVPPGDTEFRAQVARLRELAAGWEKGLSASSPEGRFLVPDAERLARLRGAAASDNEAGAAIDGRFTIADLETLALLRNPGVAARERELRAAIDGYSQAENLDTILRRYSVFTSSLMTGIGPMEGRDAMAASRFPFPGVLALKGEIVTQEATAARANLEAARRKAVTSARKIYWELLFVTDARKTTEQVHELLETLKSAAMARYSAGETSYQDVLKIAVELEKVKEEHVTFNEMQLNGEAMIRELLALPPATPIGFPADVQPAEIRPDLAALQGAAQSKRQELLAMRATLSKMERMLEMQETMLYPGFSLNLSSYDRDEVARIGGAVMGGERDNFPAATESSVGGGLPKNPWSGMQDAYLRELRDRIAAMRQDIRMEEAATTLRVRTAWFEWDKARRERALYADRVVDLSRAAFDTSARGYSAGKIMFADLIESYRGRLESGLAAGRGRADLGSAIAELEDAVGAPLGTDAAKGEKR